MVNIETCINERDYFKGWDNGWSTGWEAGRAWAIKHIKKPEDIFVTIHCDASEVTKQIKSIRKELRKQRIL
jgi:hypothetical protein